MIQQKKDLDLIAQWKYLPDQFLLYFFDYSKKSVIVSVIIFWKVIFANKSLPHLQSALLQDITRR